MSSSDSKLGWLRESVWILTTPSAAVEWKADQADRTTFDGLEVSELRSGTRRVIAALREALAEGGVEALAETHVACVRSSLSYRIASWVLELVYPLSALLGFVAAAEHFVVESGLVDGARRALEELPIRWQVEYPHGDRRSFASGPLVVFGRHGSVLTPFLVAAALGRRDLHMLGATYVAALGPGVACRVHPVHLPVPTLRTAARRGILLRIGAWAVSRLNTPTNKATARRTNLESLRSAADYVREGGALLIAPDAPNPRESWRVGIGLIACRLSEGEPVADVLFVPYRIWASITGLFHILSPNPLLRAAGRWEYRKPIRIAFGEPIALSAVVNRGGADPTRITRYLETYYRELGY